MKLTKQSSLVVLSGDEALRALLRKHLASTFELYICETVEDACELCIEQQPSDFVADLRTVIAGGHLEDRVLEELQRSLPEMRIVMITASDCPEILQRRIACTSIEHVQDSITPNDVHEIWGEAVGESSPQPNVQPAQRNEDNGEHMKVLSGITRRFETNTPSLKRMLAELEVAARHNVTILLIGETGSGKTFLSRLIHEVSPRRDEPFLHVACGALPAELIESELFGHVKGAFTSAHSDKEGKFVAAKRGTVLLDEIDVLGTEQQVKLLRVIETGEFEPVGSNTTLTSQARLVVASNLDLQPLVEQGRFRPDLYYRLNMLKFEIPPLRQRKPDIIPLAKKFIQQLSEKHRIEVHSVDESLYDALYCYPWPGNVRELENVIQRAVIYCSDGRLTADQLPPHVLSGHAGPSNDPSVSIPRNMQGRSNLEQQVAMTEREIIEQVLFKNNNSRTNTAKELGISRVTLYNKMKKYGMVK